MPHLQEFAELEIPDNLRATYKRLLNRSPREIREDCNFQRKLLTFLKMGNESTARHYIAIQKVQLFDQLSLIKKHARDVPDPDADAGYVDDAEEGDDPHRQEPEDEDDPVAVESGDEDDTAGAQSELLDDEADEDLSGDAEPDHGAP